MPAEGHEKRIEGALFVLVVGLLLTGAFYLALEWPVRASILLLVLGGIGVFLAALQIFLDFRAGSAGQARSDFETPQIQSGSRWGNIEIWGWIVGLYAAIHIIGFLIAAPLFVLAYAKFYGASWGLAAGLSAIALGFLYGVFERLLHVPWPASLLGYLL